MAKKKNKKVTPAPKADNSGAKKGKISKAREAIREEMRAIIDAAKKQNLIHATASKVRRARTFTKDDILSFISDVKVKTTNEVKKVAHRHESTNQTPTRPTSSPSIKVNDPIENKDSSMSYYDRWYSLASYKGGKESTLIIETSEPIIKEKKVFKKLPNGTSMTFKKTYREYMNGLTIEQIAENRGLTLSTICDHFAYFIEKGYVSINEVLSNDKMKIISEAITNTPSDKLSDIKNNCPNNISYDDIKLMKAHYKYLNK